MVAAFALALSLSITPVRGAAGPSDPAAPEAELRPLLENVRLRDLELSPDGNWAAYLHTQPSIDGNGYRHSVLLRRSDGNGDAQVLARTDIVSSPWASGFLRWSPASNLLAFRLGEAPLRVFDADAGERRDFAIPEADRRLFGDLTGAGVRWSPDGSRLAFVAPDPTSASDTEPTPDTGYARGFEADIYWDPDRQPETGQSPPHRPNRLWVLELDDGKLAPVSTDPFDVRGYDWSPDNRRLVVSATDTPGASRFGFDTNLYVIDSESRTATALVRDRGIDTGATWSPDGRWIAFTSQAPYLTENRQRNMRYEATVALVPADGSEPPRDLLADWRRQPHVPVELGRIRWSPDSQTVRFNGDSELRNAWFEVDIDGKNLRPAFAYNALDNFGACAWAEKRIACRRNTPTQPDQIIVRDQKDAAWRVLEAGSGTPFPNLASEIVRWRSADDRWDIHGILLKPPGFNPRRPYPLLVYLSGGPSMVRSGYGIASEYPLLALAERGYLVLAPNTRGRGGYGPDFAAAIATEGSNHIAPHGDVVTGVQMLVERGWADADRVGITGFSYGFGLGLETIAQSDRFKAASLSDGLVEMVTVGYVHAALDWHADVLRDQNGAGSILDPEHLKTLLRESTLFRLHQVQTPVLAEFGAIHTTAATQGRMLLHTLRAGNVPVEMVVYPRTDHGITEPQLRLDSMRRNLEWFDFWLLGKATERMRERYGRNAEAVKTGSGSGSGQDADPHRFANGQR